MNLIDKDALIQELDITDMDCDKCLWRDSRGCSRGSAFVRACFAIEHAPIIEERKTGKWVATDKGLKVTIYKCSECKREVMDDTGYDVVKDYPYCHCGARMVGEEE